MNSKAQAMGLMGVIFTVFIGVIVGLVLLQSAAQTVGNTAIEGNLTISQGAYTAAANGASIDLVGAEYIRYVYIVNRSGTENYGVNGGGNYTIYEGVSPTTGVKIVRLRTDSAAFASKLINVSYWYGGDGYVDDNGAKAIIGLIVIFGALAVAVVALVPTLRSGVLDMIGR